MCAEQYAVGHRALVDAGEAHFYDAFNRGMRDGHAGVVQLLLQRMLQLPCLETVEGRAVGQSSRSEQSVRAVGQSGCRERLHLKATEVGISVEVAPLHG